MGFKQGIKLISSVFLKGPSALHKKEVEGGKNISREANAIV